MDSSTLLSAAIREMTSQPRYDAVVVGAGPNGLSAAITLAQAGRSVVLVEAEETVGGGARSGELTLPGYVHDLGSAIHPLGAASPFFNSLPLARHGLEWIHPDAPVAHPLDGTVAAILERSIEETGRTLGPDSAAYRRLMEPLVEGWEDIAPVLQGPLAPPHHPITLARFGVLAIRPATMLARSVFQGARARAFLAGNGAHSLLALEQPITGAFALTLATLGHVIGWPFPRGGAQKIADALASYLTDLGGEIVTGARVTSLDALPPSRVVICDLTPRGLLEVAGSRMPTAFRRKMEGYRWGFGAFKLDWALDGPIPWSASECLRAGTVHVGGSLEEIALSERTTWHGGHSERPFVLLAQQTLFDASRAPKGKHTAWAYCHVPNGSTFDMTERIEAQVERFAPGFRHRILARCVTPPAALERQNANLIGGDVNGGIQDIRQLFTRPRAHHVPYATPVPGLYLCSSSTPPGGGVHGMCGHFAARAALRYSF
ncbi:MAG: NAD(P)/FAD-dependent oxidoreductase [Chloroflexota bacterium]|nr:NAD(P)/FAD-dependent oxidoreductase [Chloroflexota bacterium]